MNTKNNYITKNFKIALLFFFVSATYGWLMRLQHVVEIPKFIYGSFLQAHSHVTFLGWGFLAIVSLVVYAFFPKLIDNKTLKFSFWIMVVTLVGMLLSFPLQGYKLFSILFLSVYLLTSYVYLGILYKALKKKDSLSALFVRTGIIYYYISSLAIWVIPVVSLKIGKGELYHNTIGFYTHFLYNGFFVFVLFGLFFEYLNTQDTNQNKLVKKFHFYTNISLIPVFFIVLYTNKSISDIVVLIATIGVVLQLFSLFYLSLILQKNFKKLPQTNLLKSSFYIIIFAYYLKLFFQLLSVIPSVSTLAFQFKTYLVIGFIHLFTLGFMSLFLLVLYQLFTKVKLSKLGITLFILGVILSEIILFLHGGFGVFEFGIFSYFHISILLASTLMPIGILIIGIQFFQKLKLDA